MEETIIQLDHVSLTRNQTEIIKDISWKVKRGEHWALLGLNGAGKTSLLKLITGYEWVSDGQVSVLGQRFGEVNLQELRKSIGWVSSSLDERLQTRSNDSTFEVVLSGAFASIGVYEEVTAAQKDRATELIESFGLSHASDRPFRLLSQGEKKKALLARAWMASPDLLILDEPCSGLDVYSREQLLTIIHSIAEQPDGPTLIYVSHHIEEIMPPFKKVILLKNGRKLAEGKKADVINDETLTDAFSVPVSIVWEQERPWLTVVKK